jgi:hypothetical protein
MNVAFEAAVADASFEGLGNAVGVVVVVVEEDSCAADRTDLSKTTEARLNPITDRHRVVGLDRFWMVQTILDALPWDEGVVAFGEVVVVMSWGALVVGVHCRAVVATMIS